MLAKFGVLENGDSPHARGNHVVIKLGQAWLIIPSRDEAGQIDMARGLVDQEAIVAGGIIVEAAFEFFACHLRWIDCALDPEREVDNKIHVTGPLDDTNRIPTTNTPWKGDND
jgi:hypothetical protein